MANISSGNRSVSARTSRVTSVRLDPEDVDKTLAIWKGLSWELLQLKCNQYSLIATGSKKVLAKRLDEFVRARRDEGELRHIARRERDEQDAETPDTNDNIPPTEAQVPSLADLATQVKNLTEIVGHLVKRKRKSRKRKQVIPSETSDLSSDSNSDDASSSDDRLASLRKAPSQKKKHAKKHGRHGSDASSDNGSETSWTVTESEKTARELPAISTSLLRKVKAREFINFDLLLARPIDGPSDTGSQVAYNIQFSGRQGISVKAKDPTKPKVVDIVSYLEAWNVFFEATIAFHPHMVSELLGYQKMISEYAAQFKPQAWLAYDRAHRQARAVNKSKPWDERDDKAYQRFMRVYTLSPHATHAGGLATLRTLAHSGRESMAHVLSTRLHREQ